MKVRKTNCSLRKIQNWKLQKHNNTIKLYKDILENNCDINRLNPKYECTRGKNKTCKLLVDVSETDLNASFEYMNYNL